MELYAIEHMIREESNTEYVPSDFMESWVADAALNEVRCVVQLELLWLVEELPLLFEELSIRN